MLERDESLFLTFAVVWLSLGIGGTLYIRSLPTAAEKRRAHRVLAVIAGVAFGAFATWLFPPSAVFMLPAIVLITMLNLRNTRFCDQCGKMTQVQPFQRVDFCPRCGAPLPAS
ncbi:zinc ribbon domain-containing protein [Longimicrobium terrae]|uniref:Bacteriorhodopsin n=1 Tax=Longimicrobium terrae TaxID=1639882 RepID=A0A841GPI3_9BACT|nr:zinc ribbon domain-containing protein [Longimicrobium terrae]MBB4634250.1 bacteriorhodopsin [Longimicrobium terrae]MBB6068860.1 bacteriorhodopsin [Longimicrobium terrae]NNC28040.1 zinc ribbon domain-containing protein [Longimicrobium terrae]